MIEESAKPVAWSLEKIANALRDHIVEGNIIIHVPTFQRNLVWKKEQKDTFIDSIKNGFPIGTLLFYKQDERNYRLIDGLQRSSTIRDFIDNPTKYFKFDDIDDKSVEELYKLYNSDLAYNEFSDQIRSKIKNELLNYKLDFPNLIYKLSSSIITDFYKSNDSYETILDKTIELITPSILNYKNLYESISKSEIPIIIYSGSDNNLPTIFERINNQGTLLGKYQIYAASWAIKNYQVTVDNPEIIKNIIDKYENFIDDGYSLDGYDRDTIEENKTLTIFEYVLGFGKFISNKYNYLFQPDKSVQNINQVGFELINACLGRSVEEIKTLNEDLNLIDINKLETHILDAIDFVNSTLKPFIQFKGNSRENSTTIYHSSYQIVSIITAVFREKFDSKDLFIIKKDSDGNEIKERNPNAFETVKDSWDTNKNLLLKLIPQHYFFDIMSKGWADGNIGKLNSIVRENKYLQKISKDIWEAKFNDWNAGFKDQRQKKSVPSPKPTEKLFLNYIYIKQFSALDQLSQEKFDIEHLCPKDQMKKIIKNHNWDGLPISAIGNLCYLPEYDNRTKRNKTIYQDENYINGLKDRGTSIEEIEKKYTFTQKEDMDWIDGTYSDAEYSVFLENYINFLEKRFTDMKKAFYKSLNINDITEG